MPGQGKNKTVCQENIDEGGSANLISKKEALKQNVLRNKNCYYVMVKVIILQEDKIVLNLGYT